MIRIENLRSLPAYPLKDINLNVAAGEYFVILGPSGAGKTVLIEHIAGIHRPASGGIFINDKDVTFAPPEKRRVGYVPQDFVLFPFLSVKKNIAFGIDHGYGNGDESRMKEIISVLRLEGLLERGVNNLSGGEKQRVALARALAVNPHVLLLDEPFSSIDAGFRYKLWIEMRRIHREFGTTIIHITHDLEEAYTLSDRMMVMLDGEVVQAGDREEVFYAPGTRRVAEFFGIHNIFSGTVSRASGVEDRTIINCGKYEICAPFREGLSEGSRVDMCVRPQGIKVVKEGKPLKDSLADNVFSGVVVAAIPHGTTYTFYFKPDVADSAESEYFEIRIPSTVYKKMLIEEGKRISVSLKKNAVWILR